MEYETVGRKIKQYREKLNLTQQQLADKVGVTWEMISRYERGKSSPFMQIDALSKALNTEPAQLLQKDNKSSSAIEIPLYVSYSPSMKMTKQETKYYYFAPKWAFDIDNSLFAIDLEVVKVEAFEIAKTGVLYISPVKAPIKGNIVIFKRDSELVCDKYNAQKHILGTVIAQEVRFV